MPPKKQEENLLADMIRDIRHMWTHRRGQEIPGAILDTFGNLHYTTQDGRHPVMCAERRTDYGWHLVFALPPGISFARVKKHRDVFEDAVNGWINLSWDGNLHMDIYTGRVPSHVAYAWNPAPYAHMDLPVPIGYSAAGLEVVDLAALPHMRVGGTTFTGKSNFLHSLLISLTMLPRVRLAIIDLALLEFSYVRNYAAFAADTPTTLQLLIALEREMHRRRKVLDAAGVAKIQEYAGEDLPFIVLIIDEFAFVNPDGTPNKGEKELRKACQAICSNLAALARKVGIHLVLAMQRPDMKILPGQLKANLTGALSFKTINAVNSEIILDNGAAAELPDIKGRAIWQVGNRQVEVQTMHLPHDEARRRLQAGKEVSGHDSTQWWGERPRLRLPAR